MKVNVAAVFNGGGRVTACSRRVVRSVCCACFLWAFLCMYMYVFLSLLVLRVRRGI